MSSLHASKISQTTIMSVRGVSSQGNSIQSMSTKEICILVATDDFTWHNIVSRMLQICTYEVLDSGKSDDVLKAIWKRKEHVSVVFTNVHRLSSKGFDILENIKNRMNLQTIVMSPDDENVGISEEGSIFVAYIVKFLNVNDIKNLWQSALEMEKLQNLKEKQGDKQKASGTTECNTRTSPIDEVILLKCKRGRQESFEEDEEPTDGRDNGPAEKKRRMKKRSIDEVTRVNYKRVGREESSDESEESEDEREHGRAEKKTRMVWTREMHQKFLEAIEILGHEKAFPKKIVEVMEVPGLTRENVASHLQKYRMCIRRAQESDPNSLHGMNQTTAVQNQCLSLGVSPLLSNFSYGNSYLRRNVHGVYVQPPFQRTFPNGLYPSATTYPKSNQMDIRNSQRINGNGIINSQYGYAPNILLKSNFRVYNDPKKNLLMSIGGRSSLDANRPSDPCTSFLGFRLTGDGKLVEAGGKCVATSIKTTRSETLPESIANGNTSQLASTLNESQTSLLSVEDYDYAEENLIPPHPLSENDILGQEPLSEQSSILENGLINLYSPNPPENEYSNRYCSRPLDSSPQQQSFLPFYQALGGVSPAKSSTTDVTSLQQQVFMSLCQSSGDMLEAQCSMHSPPLYEVLGNEISAQCSMAMDPILQKLHSPPLSEVLSNEISAQCSIPMDSILQQLQPPPLYEVLENEISAQCSMPMDPILQQLPSPPLYEVLGNEISAQSPTISGNFARQHQCSVPPVPTSANVGTFQYTATLTTHDSPLPSMPSRGMEGILSGIGEDFWNNDIDDIIKAMNRNGQQILV